VGVEACMDVQRASRCTLQAEHTYINSCSGTQTIIGTGAHSAIIAIGARFCSSQHSERCDLPHTAHNSGLPVHWWLGYSSMHAISRNNVQGTLVFLYIDRICGGSASSLSQTGGAVI
jgi:hypothetical protein